jgi:hypothetical protein
MTVNPEVTGERLKFNVHRSPFTVQSSTFSALPAFPAFSVFWTRKLAWFR